MDVELGRVDTTWAVNLRAPLVATRAAWELWMRDNGGSVVNVASIGGLVPTPFLGAYNVAKAAVLHLTRQLAHELAPHVRVNAVAPGVVQTQFSAPLLSMVPHGWDKVHPVGRLGTEQDVARAVLFLADPDSSWISGTTLTVDGGATGATTPFAVLS
jgi:NAD(P)-dependent dehydrogenase (short-subunit alcohol dehydrogenase family)